MYIGVAALLLTILFCFVLVTMFVWSALRRRQLREQARQELLLQLARTAHSIDEWNAYLESERGRSLTQSAGLQSLVSSAEVLQIQAMNSLRGGVLMVAIGLAWVILGIWVKPHQAWVFIGALSTAVGISQLVWVVLARRFAGKKPDTHQTA